MKAKIYIVYIVVHWKSLLHLISIDCVFMPDKLTQLVFRAILDKIVGRSTDLNAYLAFLRFCHIACEHELTI